MDGGVKPPGGHDGFKQGKEVFRRWGFDAKPSDLPKGKTCQQILKSFSF